MADYFIGIDGGGSKTDFLLCDSELNVIARRVSTRSNPIDIGISAVCELLSENVALLLKDGNVQSQEVRAAFAGIAGLTSSNHTQTLASLLGDLLPNAVTAASHDGINVLFGAFPDTDGVSIICGTGSSCFVKRGRDIHRIGGYGRFDLVGNGYEIGKACVAHALKTADGRANSGIMEDLLAEQLGSDDFVGALDSVLKMSKNEIAAFARIVVTAAEQGDTAAIDIIAANMQYVAELISCAGRFFDNSYQVALAGGIFRSNFAKNTLAKMLDNRVTVVVSDTAPVFGAAAYAKTLI